MRSVNFLQARHEDALARGMVITGTLDDMPRGKGSVTDKVGNAAIKAADIETAYDEALKELDSMRAELSGYIAMLEEPTLKAVMKLRYIYGHSPETIADATYRSTRQVYRDIKRAESMIVDMCGFG